MPLINWSTQTTAAINLLQPEEEPSTKEKDGILFLAGGHQNASREGQMFCKN
jgi:hypothetical protein